MEMFSMLKHSLGSEGSNSIEKHFQIGRQVASSGPEMTWKIYDATRISDGKEASVFIFEKKIADKLHKPRRREIVTEVLKKDVKQLSQFKHPRILKVLHPVEESHELLAFATEPIFASLANVLGNYDRLPALIPSEIKDHSSSPEEIKCGILQVAEALSYLHYSEHVLHGNVSPQSIFVTKRGTWKMGGFAFSEKAKSSKQGKDVFPCSSWSSKSPKMAQPDLDFMAPEVQLDPSASIPGRSASCSSFADMFSFGMVICAIYNDGKSLIQANHSTANYSKALDRIADLFSDVADKIPLSLVEPVEKMINRDIRYRPSAQAFSLLKYFDDPVSRLLQHIDALDTKDLTQKCEYFTRLAQSISHFPKKILFSSVFPLLKDQLEYQDSLILALPSLISIVEYCTDEEYKTIVLPEFKIIYTMTRPVQATVYLLEKLDVIMSKSTEEEIKTDLLPMIFSTLESNSLQGQEAAINVFSTIKRFLDDQTMRKLVLPKAKSLFHKSTNINTKLNTLACIDRLLDNLDKMMILDEVLPFLTEINCQDVDIVMSVIAIYKHMLCDKKFGLTHNLIATKVMPTLIPLTVAPGLTMEQFDVLMDVLRDMLDQIDQQRRNKMMSEAPSLGNAHEIRRTSIDMRYATFDLTGGSTGSPTSAGRQQDSPVNSKCLLTVDDAYGSKYRPPSTPELQTKHSSESLTGPKANYRRHSSFQGLGLEEQAVLEKIVRERRASVTPRGGGASSPRPSVVGPHIMVSEASVSDFEDPFFQASVRRCSTQSDSSRRESRSESGSRLLANDNSASGQRRSSFQGLCESAMNFFVGK